MNFFFALLLVPLFISSQSTIELKNRFNTYLNFNGSLNSQVKFNDNSVSILNAGNPEFTIYLDEQPVFSNLLTSLKPQEFTSIISGKKTNIFPKNN